MKYFVPVFIVLFCYSTVFAANVIPDPKPPTLSVQPEVEGEAIAEAPESVAEEQPAAEEEAQEEGASESSEPLSFGGVKDSVTQAAKRNPIVWGILALLATYLSLKGGKKGLTALCAKYKDSVSMGEIMGTGTLVGGTFSLFNGIGLAAGWSQLITNLIVGGLLSILIGAGVTARASKKRQEQLPS